MRFIELFSGIGGFRKGLESANDKFNCIWANEIDKYAYQIYRKNFGKEELHEGDITKISADDIPDHDLLCAGFPCQAFSIAGKRKGFEDTRGTLFFDIARILSAKRPRYLFLENVKGLLSHNDGHTFRTILWVLHELGYDLQWQVLNSKSFGVPQNRERVFIIGHLRGTRRPEVFPIRQSGEEIRYNNECNKATAIYFDDSIPEATTRRGRVMNEVGALMANPRGGIAYTKEVEIIAHRKNYRRNMQVFNPDGITESLDTGQGGGRGQHTIQDTRIRRLTPTECERLQGFPDGWTEGVSDTQRYKCLGNAVTTNVIYEIGKRLYL